MASRSVLPDRARDQWAGAEKNLKTRKWVLVMDDDAIMRHVICSMLESYGYRSYGTENGDDAMLTYRKAKNCGYAFDAVILDLHVMNGKGGAETVRELLAFDPAARVIVTSGDITDPALIDYKTYGFSGALTKPFTLEQLDQAVRRAMQACEQEERLSRC